MKNLYNYFRDAIQTGDIIEFRAGTYLGESIRYFTGRDVNHSALVIKAEPGTLFPTSRIVLLEALNHGIEPSYLSTRVDETLKWKNSAVFWIPLRDKFNDVKNQIALSAIDEYMLRKPKYDYVSLFQLVVKKVSVQASKYFCSEYVHKKHAQFGVLPKESLKIALRPGDFSKYTESYLPRQMIATNDYLEKEFADVV